MRELSASNESADYLYLNPPPPLTSPGASGTLRWLSGNKMDFCFVQAADIYEMICCYANKTGL